MLRLKTAEEFQRVRQLGVVVRSQFFRVGFLSGNQRRLGIVAGKPLGNAVTRNRLKRRIREHFRNNTQLYPQGDCVVLPQKKAGALEHTEFVAQLELTLAKFSR